MLAMAEPDPHALNESLRRLHRSALVSLALCALAIGIAAFVSGEPAPSEEIEGPYSLAALALAAVAILLRRSSAAPRRSLRAFVYGSVLSLLGAVGLGVLGLFVALHESLTTIGLLYTLAGALLALRPPATLEVHELDAHGSARP